MISWGQFFGGLGGMGQSEAHQCEGWEMQNVAIPEHILRGQRNMATAWMRAVQREQADRALEIHEVRV